MQTHNDSRLNFRERKKSSFFAIIGIRELKWEKKIICSFEHLVNHLQKWFVEQPTMRNLFTDLLL